jgi:hypothetical protein
MAIHGFPLGRITLSFVPLEPSRNMHPKVLALRSASIKKSPKGLASEAVAATPLLPSS